MLGSTATTVRRLAAELGASEEDVLLACYRAGVTVMTAESVLDVAEAARVAAALRDAPRPAPTYEPLPPPRGRRRGPALALAAAGGLLAAAFVFFATGRTDDGAEGADGAGDELPPVCTLFQELRDHDDRSRAIVNRNVAVIGAGTGGEAELQRFLGEYLPYMDAELPHLRVTFEALGKELPDGLAADADVMRASSEWVVAELRDVRTVADVRAVLADPSAVSGALAAVRLDGYSRATCEISLSSVDPLG